MQSSWQHHITLDLLLSVLHQTLFHPFIAFLLPLSLRALATPYSHPSFQLTSAYFLLLSLYHILFLVSTRFASNGPAREVDYDEGGELVVITGGGSGLGECIAEIFGFRGVSVAVIDKRLGQWKEGNTEGGVRGYECDVGDRKEVERVWRRIAEDLGPPTVLINNAAVVHGKQFLDLSVEEIENTFRTNTLSHYHLTHLFLRSILQHPSERPRGGTLVTISSVLGHLGASHLSDYTASKAALLAFHASLSAELSSSYPIIKTILVTPGQLDSGMFAAVRLGGWTRRFFAPVVEVRELAVKLVAMIDSGEGGVLAEPAYARWIAWLAVLPVGLQKLLRSWSGVDDAMAGFNSTSRVITPGERADDEHLIPVIVDKKEEKI